MIRKIKMAGIFLALCSLSPVYGACNENALLEDLMTPYTNTTKSPANPLTLEEAWELACTHSPNARTLYYKALANVEKQRVFMHQLYAQNLIKRNQRNHYVSHFAQAKQNILNCRSTVRSMSRPLYAGEPQFGIELDDPVILLQFLENGRVVRETLTHKNWTGLILQEEGFRLCKGRITYANR